MIKLAFSTNAYKRASLEEAVDSIARIGYAGVELMADVPHAYPPHMPAERVTALRGQLARYRMGISNVNAFTLFAVGDTYHPTWIEDDAAHRAVRVAHTKNAIALTAAVGGKTMSLQPGGPLDHVPRATALDRYEAGLREVLPVAQARGVLLLIEPEPGLLIQHAGECVEFLQRVNHPFLKMNCDLGHFYCVGEDPAEVVRSCAPWIGHIHLEDIKENRVHQHRIPGEGALDFDGIFAAIKAIPYGQGKGRGPSGGGGGGGAGGGGDEGWVTVELYPYETTAEQAAQRAFDYLQKYL